MRIYLQLSESKIIPFNYQRNLTGAIHKWLGVDNEVHGDLALFSFSWLQNVATTPSGIKTKEGSYFFISAHDKEIIKSLIKGIQKDNQLCFGATVTEIRLSDTPEFGTNARFQYASPILVKSLVEKRMHHFEYSDQETTEYLTETLRHKLSKAGLQAEGVSVQFDKGFANPRTKIISYGDIQNRVNLCPVIIEGTPEQLQFAWDVGVGNSTGIGFGAIK